MEHPVYDIGRTLKSEKERLFSENYSQRVKDVILDFIDELSVQNLTEFRQYFYLVRLRLMSRYLGEKILEPEKGDIKKMIARLREAKTQRGGHYKENSIVDFITSLKKFYKWYKEGQFLGSVSWISSRTMPSHVEKPDFIITEEEVRKLIYCCTNSRDKALLATLYDSGCRISEVLTLRVKDVEFDDFGASLLVHGKTGNRWVRIVGNSVPLLREHIGPRDDDQYVFVGLEGDAKGKPMKYPQVSKVIRTAESKAQLKRHIHPHLFRHTRATLLASNMKEAPLEAQMGWKHGSRMTQTYVHFSRTDLDKAVLRAYGIELPEDRPGTGEKMPKKCDRCSLLNESDSRFCKRCGLPLDRELLEKFDQGKRLIEEKVLAAPDDVVSEDSKVMVQRFDSAFKDKILEAIVEQILSDPVKKEKFNSTRDGSN